MTLNSSGPLDLCGNTPGQSIAHELGRPNTPTDFNQADVRALAGIPSGPISLLDFYGKSAGGGGGTGPGPTPGAPWTVITNTTGSTAVSTSAGRSAVNFNADGTVSLVQGGEVIGWPQVTSAGKPWLQNAPAPGAGASYWMRLVINSATVGSGGTPITIATSSGSSSAGGPYTKNWAFSMTPGVWTQMSSGILISTWIGVPGSGNVTLFETEINVNATVQFAASAGGTVIYSDTVILHSGTYGV